MRWHSQFPLPPLAFVYCLCPFLLVPLHHCNWHEICGSLYLFHAVSYLEILGSGSVSKIQDKYNGQPRRPFPPGQKNAKSSVLCSTRPWVTVHPGVLPAPSEGAHLKPCVCFQLADSLVPMEIKPGISLATVSAVLHTKDNKHVLQVLRACGNPGETPPLRTALAASQTLKIRLSETCVFLKQRRHFI